MKSPREILLGKYQHEGSALDAIRRQSIQAARSTSSAKARMETPWPPLTELLFRLRWHLAGLAAVWAVIAILSALAAVPQPPSPQRTLSFAAQSATIVRENRRMVNEMLRPTGAETSATTRGTLLPRSELSSRFTTV